MALDDVTGDAVRLIDAEGARQLRVAAMMAKDIPVAQIGTIGLEFVVLNPGGRVVVPVKWNMRGASRVTECSTDPEAPAGLTVLPSYCDSKENMSLVKENESPLPITISDVNMIAASTE